MQLDRHTWSRAKFLWVQIPPWALMRELIQSLRKEGKSYKEISSMVGCSKSTVIYHCNPEEGKEQTKNRTRKCRANTVLSRRIERLNAKIRDFQRREGRLLGIREQTFSDEDAMEQLFPCGVEPVCYLSGRAINVNDSRSWQLDHVRPQKKGGDNSLHNIGLTCKEANQAKSDLTVDEFIALCKDVLEHNGYEVIRK